MDLAARGYDIKVVGHSLGAGELRGQECGGGGYLISSGLQTNVLFADKN